MIFLKSRRNKITVVANMLKYALRLDDEMHKTDLTSPPLSIVTPPVDGLAYAATSKQCAMRVASSLAFLAMFIALDQIDLIGSTDFPSISPWNPALGLCVAALVRWNSKALPLIFIGPVLSEFIGANAPSFLAGVWAGCLTVAESCAIVYGARLLARSGGHPLLKNELVALLLACFPSALVASLVQTAGITILDQVSLQPIGMTIARLWVGDVIGVFTITPLFFMQILPRPRTSLQIKRLTEIFAQGVIVMLTVWVAFGEHPQTASRYFYLVFLPMIWIVLRFGMRGAIIMNAFVQASMIFSLTLAGHEELNITLFQALLLVLAVSGLTLGLAVDQSKTATLQLRAREEELAASLKIAATGELAGTLAHELGHPLGAISNYASALNHVVRRHTPENLEAINIGNKLNQEIQRATVTLHRLRDFFRTGSLAFERTDLGDLARDAILLLKDRLADNSINPSVAIDPLPNFVLCDRIQLRAVIHNLVVNAIDALKPMPQNRRAVAIRVHRNGDTIFLEVEDSGGGVAPDVRDHIFEPLITTKKDGLGLGLSMSRSVVQAHGGSIVLEQSGLGGAKFVVGLPSDAS